MTAPKMLPFVYSCETCPNRHYDSGGRYTCGLVDCIIPVGTTSIASFCPLADFPAKTMADQAWTIEAMRDERKYGFTNMLMSYIASRFKVSLNATSGGMIFHTKEDKDIHLHPACITHHEISPLVLNFMDNSSTYRILPEQTPPKLYKQTTFGDGEAWEGVSL